jgi:hypothetical protein
MNVIPYLCIAVAAYILSIWVWNKCLCLTGKFGEEKAGADILFALAVCLVIYAVRFWTVP